MTSLQKRIMMWAVPRSVSTAMCRVMMNSGLKTQILFEPYGFSCYFSPDRVYNRYPDMPPDPKKSYVNAKRSMELPYEDKELVFVKDMPYYLAPDRMTADWIPDGYTHTFMIRHPRRSVISYMKVNVRLATWENFDPAETGYQEQVTMLHLLQQLGHRVVVIDADDLLENPEGILRAYCKEVGLEFRDSMINWERPLSDTEYQQIFGNLWEPEWLMQMAKSTKLERKPKPPAGNVDSDVSGFDPETRDLIERCVDQNMKYYEELYRMRIIV